MRRQSRRARTIGLIAPSMLAVLPICPPRGSSASVDSFITFVADPNCQDSTNSGFVNPSSNKPYACAQLKVCDTELCDW